MTDITLDRLCREEAFRGFPYQDSRGYQTLGYGCRLPINQDEAAAILRMRLAIVREDLQQQSFYNNLDAVRQSVIDDMAYNLGVSGLSGFHQMIAALEKQDYDAAADQMVSSAWYGQVGTRAPPLVALMRTGAIDA